MITERLEDMSPRGFLRLIKQDDGDIIVAVGECDLDGVVTHVSSVEFCAVGSGGGGSPNVRRALIQLMGAIARDNLDVIYSHRRGETSEPFAEESIVQWASDCKKAEVSFN